MIIFIFSLSQPFSTYFGLKWCHKRIYYFYEFCCYFFWNFQLWVGLERIGTIIFIFSLSGPSPTYYGLKRSQKWIFQFFEFFFAIFLEFSITRRVRTKWNDNYYFHSFLAFSNLFCLEMKQ